MSRPAHPASFTQQMNHHRAVMRPIPVLPHIDPLPRSENQPPAGYRGARIHGRERGPYVGRHVGPSHRPFVGVGNAVPQSIAASRRSPRANPNEDQSNRRSRVWRTAAAPPTRRTAAQPKHKYTMPAKMWLPCSALSEKRRTTNVAGMMALNGSSPRRQRRTLVCVETLFIV